MNFSSRNPNELVIVYGANGFLGSVITKRLHQSGVSVLAVIRPTSDKSRIEGLKNLQIIEEESLDWPQLIEKYKPGTVICAQWRGVSKSDREDIEIQASNIQPYLDLANTARVSLVQNFICFGSQAEAMESTERIKEAYCDSGKSSYGKAKAKLHSGLSSIFSGSDCRFIWTRVFSVFGPSDFSDSLLSQLYECDKSDNELIILNPSKFWSYLYEDDFASAIVHILENSIIADTVNVGNPKFIEIREIVAMWRGTPIEDSMNYESNQNKIGFFPDLGKLTSIGWRPSISLEEGIQRTRMAFDDRKHPE